MSFLLGPLASLAGGFIQSSAADKAAKAQKKAAKLQAQTAANQLAFAKDIYGTERGVAEATLPQQTAAITNALAKETAALREGQTAGAAALTSGQTQAIAALQKAQTQGIGALTEGEKQAINALAGTEAAQKAIYGPYMQQGTAAVNALTGALGLGDDEAGYQAFLASPLYKAMVAPALAAAERETTRRFAGTGQAGAVGQALQDRLAEVGGRGFGEYESALERARGVGLEATGAYGGAAERAAAARAGIYGQGGAARAGLYADIGTRMGS